MALVTAPAPQPRPARPAVLSAAVTATPKPTPTPSPTATPTPSPTHTPAPRPKRTTVATAGTARYGIAAGSSLASLPPSTLAARLAAIKATGVTWVRYDLEWSNVEAAGPGQYDWGTYDRLVAAAQAAGLQSLAILDYTPGWARNAACADTSMCAPSDPGAYARFAAAATARYHTAIRAWEIWNEPNNADFFQPGANPAAYAALLKAAYPAIKQVDPSATVITGGTSPADTGDGYYSPPDFIAALYAAGARGSFDAVAHHPYSFPFTAFNAYPDSAWGQTLAIRNLMVAHGDGAKKLWLTEYGAPTNGPRPKADLGTPLSQLNGGMPTTEALQAKLVTDAITKYRTYTWAGPLFWYSFQDAGTSPNTNENFFGLVRADGSHKPAYDAFVRAVTGR